MNPRKIAYSCIMISALFIFISCASTNLMSGWKDDSYKGPVKKMVVIGISKRPAIRNLFEDEWVKDLNAYGVDAVASYKIISMEELGSPQIVKTKIRQLRVDAVLMTRLIDRSSLPNYIPGSKDQVPNYATGWSYFSNATEGEYAYLETNVYDVKTEQPVWSGMSDTWISGNDRETIKSFIKVIIARLLADKIVQ